jgi:hypothetical protein
MWMQSGMFVMFPYGLQDLESMKSVLDWAEVSMKTDVPKPPHPCVLSKLVDSVANFKKILSICQKSLPTLPNFEVSVTHLIILLCFLVAYSHQLLGVHFCLP